MTDPRLSLVLFIAAGVLSGCASLHPDYEPDPDQRLRELLAPLGQTAESLPASDWPRVRFGIERLATRCPSHVPSQVAAAALAFNAGELQRAQGFVDRALDLAPSNVEARSLRVRIAVADGSMDLARRLVDDGLQLRPDAAPLYEASAWLHQLGGRPAEALVALDAAEELDAPKWRVAFHRGLVAEQSGDLNAAVRYYRSAIAEEHGCPQAEQRLSGLLAQQRLRRGR
ncbi:MAG: hypothetical protein AAF628_14910 [Planctomycetota bacterium]